MSLSKHTFVGEITVRLDKSNSIETTHYMNQISFFFVNKAMNIQLAYKTAKQEFFPNVAHMHALDYAYVCMYMVQVSLINPRSPIFGSNEQQFVF